MVIKHILKFFVLGIVVAFPFGLVTISNNYKIVSKKDDKSLNSVTPSSLALNSVELEMLSLSSNGGIFRNIDLTDNVYSKADKIISNIYQTNPYLSEKGLSSNLLIADLSTLDLGLYQNSLIPNKNIYISIDEQGDIDQEIVLISNELNELNELLETELLANNIGDLSVDDKNIYISVDEQGNIDQERTVVERNEEQLAVVDRFEEKLAVVERFEEQVVNNDTVTGNVLINIENIDGKIVQTVVKRERTNSIETVEAFETVETTNIAEDVKKSETVSLPNNYRDIAMNERDIYSSLDEVENKDKVVEKKVVIKTDKEQLSDQTTVIEMVFANIDTADKIDIETVGTVETTNVAKSVENVETIEAVETTNVAKTIETTSDTSSDAKILSNDIELYSKTDMLDTATIEMIAYSNYNTEDNNVIVEEASTDIASTTVKELEAKEFQLALAEAKVNELKIALAEAKAKKIQIAEAKKIEKREYEESIVNLASVNNITQEFASLSPSLVNRSLSIDLSIGRTDIETPLQVEGIESVNTDLILTDNLIGQKKKIEVIVVDRSNRDIKDEKYYYSKKSIPTIPSTVLESTIKGVKTEKIRIQEFGRNFRQTGFISTLYSSRQCR